MRTRFFRVADDARRQMVKANRRLNAIAALAPGAACPVALFAALLEQPSIIEAQPLVAPVVRTVPIQ